MKNKIIKNLSITCIIAIVVASCSKKLDLFPQNDLTPEKVFANAAGYKSVLAKIYGTLSITGNNGPAGSPDISGGLDEGSQVAFIRGFFNFQELPTDEAVVAWDDQTIKDFHALKWTSADPFLKGMYARPIYNITLINEYLREATPEKLSSRGITGNDAIDIKKSRAEARFLRAFNYWVMMDLFGKSTFITEADLVGSLPKEKVRTELFAYIESELKAIDAELGVAKSIEYGRVDQAAAWALLARMYLNAETYIGSKKYTEASNYATKVINAGYSLRSGYSKLFMADNDTQKGEFIFAINCDGLKTQAYGNTTFFVHAACGDESSDYGVNSGWYGYRTTSSLVNKFTDITGATDQRALFTTSLVSPTTPGQLDITDIGNFKTGARVKKWVNVRSDGLPTSDIGKNFSDVDFPVFRLSEMYLIYAECFLRNGSGDATTALNYLNKIRFRAYGDTHNGDLNASDLSSSTGLQLILDERARELYWEGHRRTDLIRYGLLTTNTYLWPWKGGVASGTSVDNKYNIYPIPAANRTANPNLTQNTGY